MAKVDRRLRWAVIQVNTLTTLERLSTVSLPCTALLHNELMLVGLYRRPLHQWCRSIRAPLPAFTCAEHGRASQICRYAILAQSSSVLRSSWRRGRRRSSAAAGQLASTQSRRRSKWDLEVEPLDRTSADTQRYEQLMPTKTTLTQNRHSQHAYPLHDLFRHILQIDERQRRSVSTLLHAYPFLACPNPLLPSRGNSARSRTA